MARDPQNTPEIERLICLSAACRSRLGHDAAALRHRLDGPARVVQSLRSHPLGWLGGALATGLGAMLVFRRKAATPRARRGLRGLVWSLALTATRPLVKTWLSVQLKQFLAAQLRPQPACRPPSNNCGSTTLRHPL